MRKFVIFSMIIIGSTIITANMGLADVNQDKAQQCVELVRKAAMLFEKADMTEEKFYKYINSEYFVEKEFYVFALTLDNVMMGHPHKKKLRGKNVNEYEDKKGIKLFQEFVRVVKSDVGEGWVEYMWDRPNDFKDEPLPKRSFVMKIPNQNIYIGAGYYPNIQLEKTAQK